MKLSKRFLAIGLSVGLVVSSVVPVFAGQYWDSLPGASTILEAIEDKCYTATEKAEIMAYADALGDKWDNVLYADGVLKLRDSRNKFWMVGINGEPSGTASDDSGVRTLAGNPVITLRDYLNNAGNMVTYHAYRGFTGVTNRMDDYEDMMYSDFENLFHKLHFDALGRDLEFRIYEKENTNVTNIGDTLMIVDVWDLLENWTDESSLINDLRRALELAPICDEKKDDDKKSDANNAATTTPTTVNCVTCNTTTTTTTTGTTTGGTGTTGTAGTTTTTVKPAGTSGSGLPLANTATNYGNVMALGIGAMVVALGVFAYSKKVTA